MPDIIVCLGCGRTVGGIGADVCACPPPSIQRPPPSSKGRTEAAAGPYRDAGAFIHCPRCEGRLAEVELHDAAVLDCLDCAGLFLPKPVIDALTSEEGKALRLAFPRRERSAEPENVRYLPCPFCRGIMNRVHFGRTSKVIVDVCKDHGIWFDVGEVNAVIAFVEEGGMERAARARDSEHAAVNAKLRAKWRDEHDAAERAGYLGRRHVKATPGEQELVRALVGWLRG